MTTPDDLTGIPLLRELVREGARWRYRGEPPEDVARQLAKELTLVEELGYASYFLTVWDVVRFARSRGILCQGRGSAANSAICFVLGITAIDPVRMGLLFERFISAERGEPPDIDVDFEHERREEVLQYVYARYGRDRAGMVCEVITYRAKSAVRDVGKALGLSVAQVDRLAKQLGMYDDLATLGPEAVQAGGARRGRLGAVRLVLELARELVGFPRHLSIHVGGFVITRRPLCETVPIEPAAMPGRTIVQWDKDDLAELDLLKVDLLGLGMLTALSRTLALLARHRPAPALADRLPQPDSLATIPAEDPAVYEMLTRADSIGVFQVESRAQMSLAPRLKPRNFYDLVISVGIVRPGPIQGGMIHPYLRRRDGKEKVRYPYPPLEPVLAKTLGVPLFQEQIMRLAVVAAGFTPGEADELRRVMTHRRSHERIQAMKARLLAGMAARGIAAADAEIIFSQLLGFAGYGFPESHSASFALLVYASAWLKRYHPAPFACALLNSQPMGFYAPHTLVEDAKRHGVEVRGVDVAASGWESALEGAAPGAPAAPGEAPCLRVGLHALRGLPRAVGDAVVAARRAGPFASLGDLVRRAEHLPGLARAPRRGGCPRRPRPGPPERDLVEPRGGDRPRGPLRRGGAGRARSGPPRGDRGGGGLGRLRDRGALRPRSPHGGLAAGPRPGAHPDRPRADAAAGPDAGGGGGARHRPAAAGDGGRDRLPVARGRDRHLEPRRDAGGLRALPDRGPRRPVPRRPGAARAERGGGEREGGLGRAPRPRAGGGTEGERVQVSTRGAPFDSGTAPRSLRSGRTGTLRTNGGSSVGSVRPERSEAGGRAESKDRSVPRHRPAAATEAAARNSRSCCRSSGTCSRRRSAP